MIFHTFFFYQISNKVSISVKMYLINSLPLQTKLGLEGNDNKNKHAHTHTHTHTHIICMAEISHCVGSRAAGFRVDRRVMVHSHNTRIRQQHSGPVLLPLFLCLVTGCFSWKFTIVQIAVGSLEKCVGTEVSAWLGKSWMSIPTQHDSIMMSLKQQDGHAWNL